MKNLTTSLRTILIFTVLTGILYPLSVTLVAQLLLPWKSNGSLIRQNGKVVGSELIAQAFSQPKYFWPRPSAVKYDSAGSGASNQSIASEDLKKAIRERVALGFTDEMQFQSGSGLDPHISREAARSQIERVAKARGLNTSQKRQLELLIDDRTEGRQLGFLGEPRINVLRLNLDVDEKLK